MKNLNPALVTDIFHFPRMDEEKQESIPLKTPQQN